MTQEHPITPPPELVQQWINEEQGVFAEHIATQAARWGADQELEACCEHLKRSMSPRATVDYLRAARRPKPTSLKEQALQALDCLCVNHTKATADENTIRRALEALPDEP